MEAEAEEELPAVQSPIQIRELDWPAQSRVGSWYRASVVHPRCGSRDVFQEQ